MNKARTALLIIDVQNDFCPGGALEVTDGADVVPIVNALQSRFDITILTQDWHPRDHRSFASNHRDAAAFSVIEMPYGPQVLWPDHCIQGGRGAAFHPDLETDRAQLIVRKGFRPEIDSYSAFFENDKTTPTGLSGYLRERQVDRVALAGLATDFCVAYSALDARRLGFEATIIEDACRAIDIDGSLASAMSDMQTQGVKFDTSQAMT